MKSNQKHLSLSDRIIIEKGLNEAKTFTAIAALVHKDPTTISKEVRKYRIIKKRKDDTRLIRCSQFKDCNHKIYAIDLIAKIYVNTAISIVEHFVLITKLKNVGD